jgi:hypothetical protein
MAIKPATLAAMQKLITLTDQLGKAHKKLAAEFDTNEKALRAAIAAKKRLQVQTGLTLTKAQIDRVEPAMTLMRKAREQLFDINADQDFVEAKSAQVLKLASMVDDAEAGLMAIFQKAKRLENDAEKGLKEAIEAENFELQSLISLGGTVKGFRAEAKATYTKTEALNTRASNAAEARNAKALAAAQAEMKALGVDSLKTMLDFHLESIDKLLERAKAKKLTADALAEMADGAKDLRAELAGAGVSVEYALKNRDRVMNELKVEEIDVKKALKVLSLDAKFEARLKKALDGPAAARVKALDAIAKEAKLDTDGKAMLAALVKQKVVAA